MIVYMGPLGKFLTVVRVQGFIQKFSVVVCKLSMRVL